jgi:hypothetical protein
MCPGVDSDSKNEYQVNPGGKGGRCLRLTTYHHIVPLSSNFPWHLRIPCALGSTQPLKMSMRLTLGVKAAGA